MWIVAIAWMYVAVMMALAEATNPQGTVLGAVITFVFYGLAPVALVMYLLATPMRRKARLATEAAEAARQAALAQGASESGEQAQPDAGSLAAGDAVAPERKEP
jgi:heme exporter protein D